MPVSGVPQDRALDLALVEAVLRRRTPDNFDPSFVLPWPRCAELIGRIETDAPALRSGLTRYLYFVHSVEGVPRGLYVAGCVEGQTTLTALATDDLRDDAHFFCSFQSKAADCSLLVVIAAAQPQLAGYDVAHVAAGVGGHTICLAAAALQLAASGLGAFFDSQVRQFFASQGADIHALYWVAIGRAQMNCEVT